MSGQLRLYRAPHSMSVITEAVLDALGTPHERIDVSPLKGETHTPEFLARNPNGKIPTLVLPDGTTTVWESSAITMYLGETYGVEKGLYPPSGPKRGEAMKWVVWAGTNLVGVTQRLFFSMPPEFRGAPPGAKSDRSEEERAEKYGKAKAEIVKMFDVLDVGLEGKEFILGDYSIVDVHLSTFVQRVNAMGVDLGQFKNLEGWSGTCKGKSNLK